MGVRRQKEQLELAFMVDDLGEARGATRQGTETPVATKQDESPTATERLMEEVCERTNAERALKRVRENKGSPGVDGMTVDQLGEHLKKHWPEIRGQLLAGTYKPQPVRRVEIPKPGGGMRKLGIPTVLDRFVQQAVMQVLQGRWDPTFSDHSFGFRPGRNAHQAVALAQGYIKEGYGVVVDIDLEKFFDRVNHDILMSRIAKRVSDKRMLKLIRAFLNSGMMENGLVSPVTEGTPQGGPLSPLVSNLLLDELDKELEKRGLHFVRFADDCNIYVRSERAGQRVMSSVERFLTKRLKLRVNKDKSAVGNPKDRKFLGFTFYGGSEPKRKISDKSLDRFKTRVREITGRSRGISIEKMVEELAKYLRGWVGYYRHCQTPSTLRDLDSWIRRRLRCMVWKQWKRGRTRYPELRKRGIDHVTAVTMSGSAHGPWRASTSRAMGRALPVSYFRTLGLPELRVAWIDA